MHANTNVRKTERNMTTGERERETRGERERKKGQIIRAERIIRLITTQNSRTNEQTPDSRQNKRRTK